MSSKTNVTVEIKNLRRKIASLRTEGTLLVIADIYEVFREEIRDQTGMEFKMGGEPIDVDRLCKRMLKLYEDYLSKLLAGQDDTTVRQLGLEEAIENAKNGEQ